MIDAITVYSLLAVTSFLNGYYGQCSFAFRNIEEIGNNSIQALKKVANNTTVSSDSDGEKAERSKKSKKKSEEKEPEKKEKKSQEVTSIIASALSSDSDYTPSLSLSSSEAFISESTLQAVKGLALKIFATNEVFFFYFFCTICLKPEDPKPNSSKLGKCTNPKCGRNIPDHLTVCKFCHSVLKACIATGASILSKDENIQQKQPGGRSLPSQLPSKISYVTTCKKCINSGYNININKFKSCPLCHSNL
jgi:hypothetical protein